MRLLHLCLITVILCGTTEPWAPLCADELASRDTAGIVTVELLSGRRFRAALDWRTTTDRLWLRWRRSSAEVLRPISWERVVRVYVGQDAYSGESFQQMVEVAVEQLAAEGAASDDVETTTAFPSPLNLPSPRGAKGTAEVISASSVRRTDGDGTEGGSNRGEASVDYNRPLNGDARNGAPGTSSTVADAKSFVHRPRWDDGSNDVVVDDQRRVASLWIDAWVANWDSDVEVDGLIVEVQPIDADGWLVPVRGTLVANLIGIEDGIVRRKDPFVRMGRWSKSVEPEDFGGYGSLAAGPARYKLPFRSFHPEFDLALKSKAALNVRLSVPGHGVFEATESSVRIRPHSQIRDMRQQLRGARFFPLERTGRSGG